LQNNMDRKKPNTHTLVPKALNLGYHARPNGAASQCHKLVVAVPLLRHYSHRHRADGQGEKCAVLKDRTERRTSPFHDRPDAEAI
jgi:hypothetical protein